MNRLKIVNYIFLSLIFLGFSLAQADTIRPKHFYITVDYLYWKAQEDLLHYALEVPGGLPNEGFLFASDFFIKNQSSKGKSGVRVRGEYIFCSEWDIALAWTHYNNCFSSRTPTIPGGILVTPFFGTADGQLFMASSAKSKWCLNYNTVDLELARESCFFDLVDVRLFLGLRGAKINQSQNLNYFELPDGLKLSLKRKNNFGGIGPRVGMDTTWQLWKNLNLISTLSGSFVYGKFNASSEYFITDEEGNSGSPDFIDKKKRISPTVQMLIGLNWEQCIDDCAIVEIGLAYEVNYWWRQWHVNPAFILNLIGNTSSSDLMLHGFTLRFGVRF